MKINRKGEVLGKVLEFKKKNKEIKWWHWESLLVAFLQLAFPIVFEILMFRGQTIQMVTVISLTVVLYVVFRHFFKLERKEVKPLTNEEKEKIDKYMRANERKSLALVFILSILFIYDAWTSNSNLIIKIIESTALPLFVTLLFTSRRRVKLIKRN
jgi:hypothetical protein